MFEQTDRFHYSKKQLKTDLVASITKSPQDEKNLQALDMLLSQRPELLNIKIDSNNTIKEMAKKQTNKKFLALVNKYQPKKRQSILKQRKVSPLLLNEIRRFKTRKIQKSSPRKMKFSSARQKQTFSRSAKKRKAITKLKTPLKRLKLKKASSSIYIGRTN